MWISFAGFLSCNICEKCYLVIEAASCDGMHLAPLTVKINSYLTFIALLEVRDKTDWFLLKLRVNVQFHSLLSPQACNYSRVTF